MRNVYCEYTESEITLPFHIPATKHTHVTLLLKTKQKNTLYVHFNIIIIFILYFYYII